MSPKEEKTNRVAWERKRKQKKKESSAHTKQTRREMVITMDKAEK